MIKNILVTLLVVTSSSAMAEWVEIGGKLPDVVVYSNPATIRHENNMINMWVLHDFKTFQVSPKGKFYRSIRALGEYDCRNYKFKTLALSIHSGSMASGETLFQSNDPTDWMPVPPETTNEMLFNVACKKM